LFYICFIYYFISISYHLFFVKHFLKLFYNVPTKAIQAPCPLYTVSSPLRLSMIEGTDIKPCSMAISGSSSTLTYSTSTSFSANCSFTIGHFMHEGVLNILILFSIFFVLRIFIFNKYWFFC